MNFAKNLSILIIIQNYFNKPNLLMQQLQPNTFEVLKLLKLKNLFISLAMKIYILL